MRRPKHAPTDVNKAPYGSLGARCEQVSRNFETLENLLRNLGNLAVVEEKQEELPTTTDTPEMFVTGRDRTGEGVEQEKDFPATYPPELFVFGRCASEDTRTVEKPSDDAESYCRAPVSKDFTYRYEEHAGSESSNSFQGSGIDFCMVCGEEDFDLRRCQFGDCVNLAHERCALAQGAHPDAIERDEWLCPSCAQEGKCLSADESCGSEDDNKANPLRIGMQTSTPLPSQSKRVRFKTSLIETDSDEESVPDDDDFLDSIPEYREFEAQREAHERARALARRGTR